MSQNPNIPDKPINPTLSAAHTVEKGQPIGADRQSPIPTPTGGVVDPNVLAAVAGVLAALGLKPNPQQDTTPVQYIDGSGNPIDAADLAPLKGKRPPLIRGAAPGEVFYESPEMGGPATAVN